MRVPVLTVVVGIIVSGIVSGYVLGVLVWRRRIALYPDGFLGVDSGRQREPQ